MKTLIRVTIALAVIGLLVSISLADNAEATNKEIFTAAFMSILSSSTIITLSIIKENYGASKK